jgi:4-hydroxybenzoate polyprenyltransferase
MSPKTKHKEVKFKNLGLFFLAATAVMFAGFVLSSEQDWKLVNLLTAINIVGVFLVYRLNDCIDQNEGLKFNLTAFFSNRLHQFVGGVFFFVLIPLSFLWLPSFTLITLTVGAVIGIGYSLTLNLDGKQLRLKNVFIVKNLLIGIVWGALVLIGAGDGLNPFVIALFGFVSLQVVIGSIIRDVPDVVKDKESGVKSLPVVVGVKNSIHVMMLLNVLSMIPFLLDEVYAEFIIYLVFVFAYRSINLMFLLKGKQMNFWSQTFNLMCCVLIFAVVLIFKLNGNS